MKHFNWRGLLAAAALVAAGQVAAQQPAPAPQTPPSPAAQEVRDNLAQPYNNAPFWREVRAGDPGFTQLGAPAERGVLIESSGQTWRQARDMLSLAFGIILLGAIAALAAFRFFRGPIPVGASGSGKLVKRFERADILAHWVMAIPWFILAVTGILITFAKFTLGPVIGLGATSWIVVTAKNLHNFIGPFLLIGVPWMIWRYRRFNSFGKQDVIWLSKVVKNMTSDHEYPSHKFNGGEKMVFWIVLVLCTTTLIISGFVLLFPNFGQPRPTMQVAHVIHMLAGYGAISLACVHFYLGTVGLNGAYRAMTHGYVTAEWAHHHHELWYDDAKAGKLPESPMVNANDVPEETRKIVLAACK